MPIEKYCSFVCNTISGFDYLNKKRTKDQKAFKTKQIIRNAYPGRNKRSEVSRQHKIIFL